MRDQTWVAVSSIRCRLLPTGKARGRSMIPGRHPGGVNLDGRFASCQRPFRRQPRGAGLFDSPGGRIYTSGLSSGVEHPRETRLYGAATCRTGRACDGACVPCGAFPRATNSERHATDVQEAQQQETAEGPRLPGPNEDEGRPTRPLPPQEEGPRAPDRERRVPPQAAQSLTPARPRRTLPRRLT